MVSQDCRRQLEGYGLTTANILTTGGSVIEVIEAVKRVGGIVVGAGVLVDRTQQNIEIGAPLFSCLQSATPTYTPAECPLCAAGIPLTKPGGQA